MTRLTQAKARGAVFRRTGFGDLPRLGASTRFSAVETIGASIAASAATGSSSIAGRGSPGGFKREFPAWEAKLGADHLVDLSVLGQISDSALTSDAEIAFAENGLPNTFVPGRNLRVLHHRGGDQVSARAPPPGRAGCARPIIRAIPIAATTR